MDIKDYIGNVKTFKQEDLLNALNAIEVRANDLLNNLEQIQVNNLDLSKFESSWYVTKGLSRHLENQGFGALDLFKVQTVGAQAIKSALEPLGKMIKDYHEKLWDGKLITLKQANILNLIEYMNFWLKYSFMVCDVLMTMNNDGESPDRYLGKGDLRWIQGTEGFYRSFTVDLLKGSRYIMTNLEKIPDVEISQGSLDVLDALGEKEAVGSDLLAKGFGIHLMNPYFWFSVGRSKYHLMRIEQMRRENELFAMKISKAINKRDGSNDPQIDRQIEVYQEAIIKNEHAIEEIEKDYA